MQDAELTVCAPILEYSPLLNDDGLLEIMALGPVQGALTAISSRENLAPQASDAVSLNGNSEAIAQLLANPSAQIREDTLDRIVDNAPEQPTWQDSLVHRDDLSHRALRHAARFITSSLLFFFSPCLSSAMTWIAESRRKLSTWSMKG